MKKKLAMRVASLALCVVFTGMLFGAPKAKAVVTETAIGTAAIASYFQATGLTMAASAGSTGALVTTGIADIAGSYAMATGAASSGSTFLSSLAAGVSISPAGAIVLTAAAVVAIGALVVWYINENGLDSVGDSVAPVPGVSSGSVVCSGLSFPDFSGLSGYADSYWFIRRNSDGSYRLYSLKERLVFSDSIVHMESGNFYKSWTYTPGAFEWVVKSSGSAATTSTSICNPSNGQVAIWTDTDILDSDSGGLYLAASSSILDYSDRLEVVRTPEFTQPDTEFFADSKKEMVIDLGLSPGTTLDLAVEQVPELIVAGDFAPTYEITTEGTGEGAGEGEGMDDSAVPDDTTVVPGVTPWLESIFNAIKGIADKIVNGIKGLFVPDQAAVDSLSAQVDAKLPFIGTLQGFGGDLAYKLEHPEECANGLGLTTVVDLGKGRSSYLGDTKHDLLDVSWYLEYKPMVDDIIVGFCWLCFLWNCYGALPRIIHGEGSIAGVISILRKEDGNP